MSKSETSQCFNCKHYEPAECIELAKCKAFPDKIPDKVIFNEIIHNKRIKGQTGNYIFESKGGK